MRSVEQWASRYISKYGLALVPIPLGHKAPLHPGWNQRGGYVTDIGEAQQRWGELPDDGIGAVLGPSGLCSIDVDAPDHALPVLGELGIDLGALRKATPTIQGNPSRYRLMFKAPPGVVLGRKALSWPAKEPGGKPVVVFELRAGDIQDVLPPTIHPGTRKPYVWLITPNSEFPLLPEALLELWQHWDSYRKELEAMCPWAKHGFNPEPAPRVDGSRPSVIAAFDRAHCVEDLLKEHGYTPKGKRWLSPTSSSGLAGVVILNGKAFFHHSSDPLADGHTHDAFDLYRLLDHGGDARSAVKAAAEELGMGSTASTKASGPEAAPRDDSASPERPEPQPLPDGLPPVAAFDFALLPDTLRPWVEDTCELVQCAPDYIAATVMTALGAVIGRKIGIRPQARTEWTVTVNQWALEIGRPGVLKSPAMEAALLPAKRLAAKAVEAYEAEMGTYRQVAKLAKIKADEGEKAARAALKKNSMCDVSHLLDGDDPPPPVLRRYMTNDTSAAALGELHRQNPNGLLVVRDELVSLLAVLDREDNAEARGFYLTGWNGDSPYTIDRIGRGMHLHIPAVCLSLLGSTQPGRIEKYIRAAVRGGAGDDGLLQRFGLLVWPDTEGDWRNVDRWADGDAKREAHRVFEYLDKLDPVGVGAHQDTDQEGALNGLPFLRFSGAALEVFMEWRTKLEARLRSGDLHPAMESHLAKYRKLVPGLALLLHLADRGTGPVSEKPALQALAWAEYLESHATRAYASVTMTGVTAAKAILARVRKGDLPRSFAGWQVWRKGWAMLSDRAIVADALSLLVDLGWLVECRRETGGRSATIYQMNPRGAAL